jgi:hypothetical protein
MLSESMGAAGRARVEEKYNVRTQVAKLEHLYDTPLQSRSHCRSQDRAKTGLEG